MTDNESLLVDVIRELREAVDDACAQAEYIRPDVSAYINSTVEYCDRVLKQFGVRQ